MNGLGRILIIAGIALIIVGVLLILLPKKTLFGHLPGDIYIKRDKFTFYFPIVTCILISLALTLILWIISNFRK